MELAVHARTLRARHPAIHRSTVESTHQLVVTDQKYQCRLSHHLPRASGHGNLCWLQQQPPEPRSSADSDSDRLAPPTEGLHQRWPPVLREGVLPFPLLAMFYAGWSKS